ncbi:MAG: zf-HC2 domain-containing protein [Candidatus Eremiobacteraeota bacterium]|nr:zf-HC2 domain-containing protein [Candidatus Eremiobacteraeota bacterium]
MNDHITELADAYALGALEQPERTRVDAHLARCVRCTRAVGEAETLVTRLILATTSLVEPPGGLERRVAPAARRQWPVWGSLAAALALSVGINATLLRHDSDVKTLALMDDAALSTIATSHFRHETLTPRRPGAPIAKALYAADGTWLYVIVDATDCRCRVVIKNNSGERDLGAPHAGSKASTLFERGQGSPQTVALVDGAGRVVADAELP